MSATNVKIDAEKLQLAKLKGINVSQVCREALDSRLKLDGDDIEMINQQLVDIEKQIQELTLEKKFLLSQLETLDDNHYRDQHREAKYQQYKKNLAVLIKNKAIDWKLQKEVFKFKTVSEGRKWIEMRLRNDSLI